MNTISQDIKRNLPADKGRNNDPQRREESAQQPGVSTYSSSDTDSLNQDLTETASDNFREEAFGKDADPNYDEIGNSKQEHDE
ncbi:hypothetical protein [Flavisolibacter tropicus]|uniref:Uncharacterized protein n=1 Tax=Flavisolibacter tropicus TaxID=1492898 RepID=A0A172U029_9BACT|nr:hypothetical protein [Flavisolibacter tropicus]ANE52705.1 hypothetical protein SY85_21730 [Flavisolibacter tropicus]